ncbi:UTP--glucose-1-phosphate uridylyltransferase GalU [Malacoplasma iowae]|uniref:UTP--glucose-1-phosphate uridylyltransferase GalU n=1 Tax=Malacoplasma iowae TaxID=2116 RepID=UPI00387323F3|nr:UTP--glucose-1-phosphate uridylyltransferase GalU [Malacoplasma iowae]
MKTKIKKAIIPAAGMGTRFLPITKSIPKEMLPIVDKPAIHYIVEEAVASGITDILIIVSSAKNSLIDYFDYSFELQSRLLNKNKQLELNLLKNVADMANIFFIRQKEPLGLGHAIKLAKNFVNNEPFAVLLGDDVVINDILEKPALKQCIDSFYKTQSTILGVQSIDVKESYKYGMISINEIKSNYLKNKDLFLINDIVEKPSTKYSPSNYAVMGRYIFKPNIFDCLEKIEFDDLGELQITSAIHELIKIDSVYAKDFVGKRYDLGSKEGYLKANIDVGINNYDIKNTLKEHLNFLINKK